MADQELVDLLRQGPDVWNRWRVENPDPQALDLSQAQLRKADLRGAILSGANLRRADLSWTILNEADLRGADLHEADLHMADLIGVDLSGADLSGADLSGECLTDWFARDDLTKSHHSRAHLARTQLNMSRIADGFRAGSFTIGADLCGANLSGADLSGADLTGANLDGVNLSGADLHGADLGRVVVCSTIFGGLDLSQVIGLDSLIHGGPSTIGIDTIHLSQGKISEAFLREAGVPDVFTTYISALMGEPLQFYSCFISHASEDGAFSDRLRSDLLANNVSCWHYRHDMRGGRFWRTQINEAIKVHDKLVLICSKDGLQERNVVDEIVAAMERERETGAQKLFPIRLDDFILSDEMLMLADEKMDAGQWREDWVRPVRAYHIPDFSMWKSDHDLYQAEFKKLLDALKNPASR